jgi:hypothetical protein
MEAGPVFPDGRLRKVLRPRKLYFLASLPLPCLLSRNSNIGGYSSVLVLFNLPFIRWKHHLRIYSPFCNPGLPFFCRLLSHQELQEKVCASRFLLPGF